MKFILITGDGKEHSGQALGGLDMETGVDFTNLELKHVMWDDTGEITYPEVPEPTFLSVLHSYDVILRENRGIQRINANRYEWNTDLGLIFFYGNDGGLERVQDTFQAEFVLAVLENE